MSDGSGIVSSPVRPVSPARPAGVDFARTSSPSRWRIIPPLETFPRIVSFSQTAPGKGALLAVFGVCLFHLSPSRWPLLCVLAVISFAPQPTRRLLAALGTFAVLATTTFWNNPSLYETVARQSALNPLSHFAIIGVFAVPFLLLAAGLMWLARRHKGSWMARRPLWFLSATYAALLLAACYVPARGMLRFALWGTVITFGGYFWYLAYSLVDSVSPKGDGILLQLGTFHPFWGGTLLPYPKGASYWRKIQAKDAAEFAIAQLKGVKLIVWALLLRFTLMIYVLVVHSHFGLPTFDDVLAHGARHQPDPVSLCWATLISSFFTDLLSLAVWGHTIIASCRMAGFNALRNTRRPLQSRSIAEFWNRFHFYFKELLVDLFFHPAFLRCHFKDHKRLRVAWATFAAAGLGNAFFHFMRDIHHVVALGLGRALAGFQCYLFYCLVLASGIAFSQVRSRKTHARRGWVRAKLLPPLLVLFFYCLLHVFDTTGPASLADRWTYFAHLFYWG